MRAHRCRSGRLALLLAVAAALPETALDATDLAADYGGCAGTVPERVIPGTPADYRSLLPGLGPGDLLQLAAGTYTQGLPLEDLAGQPDRCITVAGPAAGPAATFTGRDCCNTVSIVDSSYLVIRHLVLDGQGRAGDAVKAEGTAAFAHHVTLENLTIRGHDADQQIVGISTKCPAWNWVIRNNVVEGAGTGLYLGDSDGSAEFVHGLIEHNLVVDTLGYNLQVKHQNGRDTAVGVPAAGITVIRHNVFSKAAGAATGGNARPNLLLGHQPPSGPGASDEVHVYGNLFFENETAVEPLVQAEGNVILYDNLLYNSHGTAVAVRPHNDVPKKVRLFHNTVVAAGTGLSVSGGDPAFEQRIEANAVFAATPLAGGIQAANVTGSFAAASSFLNSPSGVLPGMDLYPLPGALGGPAVDLAPFAAFTDGGRDFNGRPRSGVFRGAYAGEGTNPGWSLALERKPPVTAIFADGFESGDLAAWSSQAGGGG